MENTTAGEAPVVEFCANALAPVSMFKAENDVRFYLNGICVMPNKNGKGCFIVGCDGHRLAIWFDQDGSCSEKTVLRVDPAMIAAAKRKKKGREPGSVMLDGGRLVLKSVNGEELFIQAGKAVVEMRNRSSDGRGWALLGPKYPDFWSVIPAEKDLLPGMVGSFNAKYMEDLGKVGRMLGTARSWCGVHHFHDKNSAPHGKCVTRFYNAPNFMVVTMGMRSETDITKNPLLDAVVAHHVPDTSPAPATLLHPMGSMGEAV